jgi:hypothetical protein
MKMNAKTKASVTLAAGMLIVSLFLVEQLTLAQTTRGLFLREDSRPTNSSQSANIHCKKLKGSSVQIYDPATGIVTGPVTNAGFLNGTLEDIINFGAGFVVTPDPTVFAYITDLTITTNQGQLKASPVTTQSVVTADGAEWGQINPDTSTGRFAGATGIIHIRFQLIGDPSVGPWEAEITGEICFPQ